jgi:predicted Zn-dependent peptidase
LCYSISTFTSAFADGGLLGIYAGTGAKQLKQLMQVAADETAALVAEPEPAEIARARAQLKAGLLMSLESCSSVCEEIARHLLCFGRRIPTGEIVARLDAVDVDAVRRVGRRVLAAGQPTITALGPVRRLPTVALDKLAS